MEETTKKRVQEWIIVGIAIPFILLLLNILVKSITENKTAPQFIMEGKIIINPADPIYIRAENKEANQNKPLNIQFHQRILPRAGIPLDQKTIGKASWQRWKFKLADYDPPDEFIQEKSDHPIKAGFPGEPLDDLGAVRFYATPPKTEIKTQSTPAKDRHLLQVTSISEGQIPGNALQAKIVFIENDREIRLDLPMHPKKDPVSGQLYYASATDIQHLSRAEDGSEKSVNTKIRIEVRDQAGNLFSIEEKMGDFFTETSRSIGDLDLAGKDTDAFQEQPDAASQAQETDAVQKIHALPDGRPPVDLKIPFGSSGKRILQWKTRAGEPPVFAVVYRDNRRIGISFGNSFVDNDSLAVSKAAYRVEIKGSDGIFYVSADMPVKIGDSAIEKISVGIFANVPDARVYIDGELKGQTPITLSLDPDSYFLAVQKEGYEDYKGQILVTADREIRAILERVGEGRDGKIPETSKPGSVDTSGGKPDKEAVSPPSDEMGSGLIAGNDDAGRNIETNSLGMAFVYIPPGEFMMGSPEDDPNAYFDEKPAHEVIISKGFYLQKTEVTQRQWEAVMGNNPSSNKECGGDCPVNNVSWNDAQEFIKALNSREGGDYYRLPTEAEWEYACRAKTKTTWHFGEDEEKLVEYAWYSKSMDRGLHPVGQLKPNPWGLHDMYGNVWELCEDDWHNSYEGAPENGNAWVEDPRGSDRVSRGGPWVDVARLCRSASRQIDVPALRIAYRGFRLVLLPGQR